MFGVNDDLTDSVNLDDFGIAVGLENIQLNDDQMGSRIIPHLAGMVYKSGQVTTLCSVHHIVQIYSEQVRGANTLKEKKRKPGTKSLY